MRAILITVSPVPRSNANWWALCAYMSDLRAVVSNTLLLTQQPGTGQCLSLLYISLVSIQL